jgi:hypothetical protein
MTAAARIVRYDLFDIIAPEEDIGRRTPLGHPLMPETPKSEQDSTVWSVEG